MSENIALNDSNVDEQDIIHAAKIACAHDFIMELDGYATQLSEKVPIYPVDNVSVLLLLELFLPIHVCLFLMKLRVLWISKLSDNCVEIFKIGL